MRKNDRGGRPHIAKLVDYQQFRADSIFKTWRGLALHMPAHEVQTTHIILESAHYMPAGKVQLPIHTLGSQDA